MAMNMTWQKIHVSCAKVSHSATIFFFLSHLLCNACMNSFHEKSAECVMLPSCFTFIHIFFSWDLFQHDVPRKAQAIWCHILNNFHIHNISYFSSLLDLVKSLSLAFIDTSHGCLIFKKSWKEEEEADWKTNGKNRQRK